MNSFSHSVILLKNLAISVVVVHNQPLLMFSFCRSEGVLSSLAQLVPKQERVTAQTARINLQRQEVHSSVFSISLTKYFI